MTLKRYRISNGLQVFATAKGLLFSSKSSLEDFLLNSGKNIYKDLPLSKNTYVNTTEYRKLNRELA